MFDLVLRAYTKKFRAIPSCISRETDDLASNSLLILIAAVMIANFSTVSASAQTSLKSITDQLDANTEEFNEVDKILASPDRNRRIAGMELLLASKNPVFIKRAKETGLLSSDAELQEAALKAIFEAGGPFRLIVDLGDGDDDKTRGKQWATSAATLDAEGTTATYSFRVDPFDPKENCWKFHGYPTCAIYLTGTAISLQDWSTGTGILKLGTDGALGGSFLVRGAKIGLKAKIPLID